MKSNATFYRATSKANPPRIGGGPVIPFVTGELLQRGCRAGARSPEPPLASRAAQLQSRDGEGAVITEGPPSWRHCLAAVHTKRGRPFRLVWTSCRRPINRLMRRRPARTTEDCRYEFVTFEPGR